MRTGRRRPGAKPRQRCATSEALPSCSQSSSGVYRAAERCLSCMCLAIACAGVGGSAARDSGGERRRSPLLRRAGRGARLVGRCVAAADSSPQADASLASSVLPRVPRARTRLHINPLSPEFLKPPPPPDWGALLRDPRLPLHLDLGCAYGEFALAMAERDAGCNFVGVDLRERVLSRAAALRGPPNVAFLFANARADAFLEALLATYPGELRLVSCLFPDPWTQARYVRRRLVQPALVAAVAARLAPGGAFVTATDNAELAAEMRRPFLADPAAWEPGCSAAAVDGWDSDSPFPVATQWECTARGRGSPLYWARFVRTAAACATD